MPVILISILAVEDSLRFTEPHRQLIHFAAP